MWVEVGVLLEYAVCVSAILVMLYFFGDTGLIVYAALAVVAANLQVLKATVSVFSPVPVALGTVVFSSTFLVSDILTECFGAARAKQAVGMGFFSLLLMCVWMNLTCWFPTAPSYEPINEALQRLFKPEWALLAASVVAYVTSQYADIVLFQKIKNHTGTQALWLRTCVASSAAAFLDTTLFSVLAWVVFSVHPMPWATVWSTYILGTYLFRCVMIVCEMPVLYGVKTLIRSSKIRGA